MDGNIRLGEVCGDWTTSIVKFDESFKVLERINVDKFMKIGISFFVEIGRKLDEFENNVEI